MPYRNREKQHAYCREYMQKRQKRIKAMEDKIAEANKILNEFPQENQSKYWKSFCDDDIQDEFLCTLYFADLKLWREKLCVVLRDSKEGVKK